ncbi:MAG: thioredoxin domain-containing protein [Chloroflexi bacterium]|nr:thioredoxin domain-containing protein [Chloroflexota bacterium]
MEDQKQKRGEDRFTNRLINETSPYLLQHAHNPVDWYAWGEEVLAKAKTDNKPILLSIGYSACHWCHVMAHESFEDEVTARLMNENFVNIKVDREERPDLDAVYMEAVQALTGRGGWPMTVFLTPEGIPFYAGTYFPPDNRHSGMPSFRQVLTILAQTYQEKPEDIAQNAQQIKEVLQQSTSHFQASERLLTIDLLESALQILLNQFDNRNGGLGHAPKFPQPMALEFVLRSYRRTGNTMARQLLELTLEKMALGGMYDQLGGGFCRYSTDAIWLVPHFEKMLYDNSQLSLLYLYAYQAFGDEFYKHVAVETLEYVRREMLSPEGGFYSTQDADSEGEEGKFFVWSKAEIEQVLGSDDARLFSLYYGVTEQGNFEGKNILYVTGTLEEVAQQAGVNQEELAAALGRSKAKLFERREQRLSPGTDDKILTAWNGQMLKSFAYASRILGEPVYRDIAVRNAQFLLSKLRREDGRLYRTYKAGHTAKLNGYLEDYANLIDGLLALYEATFEMRWLDEALGLALVMVEKFWDEATSSFYDTASDHEQLVVRPRSLFDNATPSGNAVAAEVLLRLELLSGDSGERFRSKAGALLQAVAPAAAQMPSGFGRMLSTLDFYLGSPKEVVIVGEEGSADTDVLLDEVYRHYLPNRVVMLRPLSLNESDVERWPLLINRTLLADKATAYVCQDYACQRPVDSLEGLSKQLN